MRRTVPDRTCNLAMLRVVIVLALLSCGAIAQSAPDCCPAQPTAEKQKVLWESLRRTVEQEDHRLDGVLGVAIMDLADSHTLLWHADDIFPTASSIKIAVLAELYL